MTSDELYNAALKRLAATPIQRLTEADSTATLDNPLCGDRVTIDLRLKDGRIAEIGGAVRGCLLCQAATTALAQMAIGRTGAEAERLATDTAAILSGTEPPPPLLEPFLPVRPFRSRHTCVQLPFQALTKALKPA